MADEMMGIEKLRRASTQTKFNDCRICEASGIEIDCDEYCNDERGRSLAAIADQIEREHAEELAAAKRDLTDEAREAVERLRAIGDGNSSIELFNEILDSLGIGAASITVRIRALRDRLIELIEHGGKRDADVAALRELADELDKRAHGAYGKTFVNASMYAGLMHGLSKRIRKAVDGATVPDAESDAERACAALLEWRDQVAGLLGIDGGSMADEVQDAIMAELDKRLMPPGMEWPRWEDGKPLCEDDAPDGVTVVSLYLDGSGYGLVDAILNHQAGERVKIVKRPEPEVMGADGEPIKVGETVWDSTSPNDPTSSTVWRHGGPLKVLRRNDVRAGNVICENDQGIPLDCCAADLTHAAPDTQERIDGDKRKPYDDYWGCNTNITCSDCPAVIDGMKPYEYYGVLNCRVAQGMDIARRKHELDAKTVGGE